MSVAAVDDEPMELFDDADACDSANDEAEQSVAAADEGLMVLLDTDDVW